VSWQFVVPRQETLFRICRAAKSMPKSNLWEIRLWFLACIFPDADFDDVWLGVA
jgi:hypothetical protein